jgi:RimJ/RimL family protein N-acetyltransferase
MEAPIIHTERFLIRPFKVADTKLWQSWDVDSEIQAYMPEPMNEPQDITKQYKYIKECEEEEDGYYWSIEEKTGPTIGTVALTDINEHHKLALVGIVIGDKDYWGKGVATEVLATVIEFAFTEVGVVRISAETEAENVAVSKVLEKVGFIHDGTFPSARVKNGKRIEVKHYGIINTNK